VLTAEENDLLCRVEGGAPMGRLMRGHWVPACLSEEIAAPDGAPVRVRLLGEDLVAFRDSRGRPGVIGEFCPHRGASLALARNEECGLRCLYHGWKFDLDGNVLEMPSEPGDSGFARKLRHVAYPAREAGGFVWIWMGAREAMTELPGPPWAGGNGAPVSVVKMHVACNWAQVLEGAIDSAHSSTLHSTDMPSARVDGAKATGTVWPRPSTDKAPRMVVERSDYGFRYAAIRRPIKDPESHDYVRITVYLAPFLALIPPNDVYNLSQAIVPIDDVNTMFHFIAWADGDKPGIDQATWRKFCVAEVGVDLDSRFRRVRTLANDFRQDRAAMARGDWTGIKGIPTQDMAMWETMGPIADRTRERLGASDVAIIQFRKLMVDAARAVRDGGTALGGAPPAGLRSFEGIVQKGVDWRTLGIGAAARERATA
jgi:phthalate 4,5-dioxygenase oxygenase subunit